MWDVAVKLSCILLLYADNVHSSSPCDLQYDAGPCRGLKSVVAFENGKCVPKMYGGCGGNDNRFDSVKECEETCGGVLNQRFTPRNPICLEAAVTSTRACRGIFPRFTFNSEAGRCEKIVYGGVLNQRFTPRYPVLGGYGGSEDIGHEQKIIAATATSSFLSSVSGVTGEECDHLTLVEVVDFSRQIVAGTNFRLSLRLRSRSGSDCSEVVERVCENIVLYRPLPYACTPSKDNSQCLTLSRPEDISCQ